MKALATYILLALFCFGSQQAYSQDKLSKKEQKYFDIAKYEFGLNKFKTAKENFQLVLKTNPNYYEAQLYVANIHFKLEEYNEAISLYEKIVQQKDYPIKIDYILAQAYFNVLKLDKSLAKINQYLSHDKLSAKSVEAANALKTNILFSKEAVLNKVDFAPRNLGASVNSTDNEYLPSLSADEATVIYTRKIKNQEDLYITGKKDGQWIPSKPMEENVINTGHNEGAHCISANGKVLLYTICNERTSLGSCDLYFSKKIKDGWTQPINIGRPINSTAWDAQPSLSADGKTLYFVSNRQGGFGGKDIYVSHFVNNKWSIPKNVGPGINSSGNEQSPFIHFDNQTLYFSSDGHPGFGKQDIYFSRKEDGQFLKTKNLGYPINTHLNESGVSISLSGDLAYYAAEKDEGFGGLDLYEFQTPDFAKPNRVTYVKGTIKDAKSKKYIDAKFALYDLEGKEQIIEAISQDGSFLICIPSGKEYSLHIKKDGYLFESHHFQLKDTVVREATLLSITLNPIEKGKSVILQNVFFETNSFELTASSQNELDELYHLLNKSKDTRLEISGHTDNVGQADYNLNLSQKRAQSVVNFLIAKGIAPNRLIAKGYGDQRPIAENTSEEGRAINRRTEFIVID